MFVLALPWPLAYGIFYFMNADKAQDCYANETSKQAFGKDMGVDATNVTQLFNDLLFGAFATSLILLVLAAVYDYQFARFQKEDASEARSTYFKCFLCLFPAQFLAISISIIVIRFSNAARVCSGDFLNDGEKVGDLYDKSNGDFLHVMAWLFIVMYASSGFCCCSLICYGGYMVSKMKRG